MKKMTTARFIAFWLCLCPLFCMAQDRYNDSLALVALHTATDGTNWTNTWNLTESMDTWHGVGLSENGRVDFLDLSSNELSGNIPPEIGQLTNLVRLWISDNQLTGNIPPEIENMTSLITVILSGNQLSGEIPVEITNLATHHLTYLSLGSNQLSGSIPSQFGNMTNLISLSLENNQLTGNIPPEIGNMTNLEGINLSGNQLTGNIPPQIGNLINLKHLYLTNNGLTGNIPDEIGNLINLQSLYLYNNELTGNIPNTIGNLVNLKIISAYNNQLTGNLPDSIGNMTSLEELRLTHNQLTGSIPASIGNLANLTTLVLSANQLTGSIPASMENLLNLTALYLNDNQLSGSIPPEIGNMINLTDLYIYNNQLSGCYDNNLASLCNQLSCNDCISNGNSFDTSFEDFCNTGEGGCDTIPCRERDSIALVALYNSTNGTDWINSWDLTLPMDTWYGVNLDLNGCVLCIDMDGVVNCIDNYGIPGNNLSGNIPPEIGDLDKLQFLSFANNQLNGSIPPEIKNLNNLVSLMLYENQISGNIPPQIGNLNSLQILSWDNNQLSGSIPPQIGNLSNLTYLSLWENQLTGNIPPEIGNLSNLTRLSLDSNNLTDSIPSTIGNLTNLTDLTINDNQLSGCYDDNLLNLCSQLSASFNTNEYISDGNSFINSWEDFCNIGEGLCSTYIPCRQDDSLALIALYEATDGANWTHTWDLNLPISTWYGVNLDLNGCVTCIDMDGVDNNCGDDYFDGGNNLQGNIPPEIGNLKSLDHLILMNNQLTGSIPPEIEGLEQLISLLLGGNQLSGSIPPEMGNMDNLKVMNLAFNKLSGSIPPEIGNLEYLSSLQLWGNQLTGNIPPQIGNLSNLWSLILHENQLTDSIPPEIGNLTNLRQLYLHYNQLTGDIPPKILDLTHLEHLYLSHNQLTGSAPNFVVLTDLQTLHLDHNKFSFDAIEAIYDSISANVDFWYSPQYHGEPQGYTQDFGNNLTLTFSEPLLGNNNQEFSYQWKKNDSKLTGSTDSIYTIDSLQLSGVGKYTLHATDTSRVPDLEIISEPIYTIIPGYDSYGQPVEYNQIMVEFDNEANRIHYENTYLYPNFGYVAKSCDCNRELHLWQFQSDEIALEVFLEVNTKREPQREDAEIDGGFNNSLNIDSLFSGQGRNWYADYLNSYPDAVTVYMLDSGTDISNWDASSYLINDAPVDTCYDYDIELSAGYDYTTDTINGDFSDSIGHGTFGTRAIAEGTDDFMNLSIVPLKVFDEQGQGTLFDFICGLYHAIDHDADIINISAGYSGQPSSILEKAIALAHSEGQFIVTAAGNEGVNIDSFPQYPAYYAKPFYKTAYDGSDSLVHYDNVISVAALNAMDNLWQHSNYGNEAATISAYGENMGGYSHTGENINSSGSSMSAYYVTRQLAVEMAKDTSRTYQQIWEDFEDSSLRDCPSTSGFTSTGKCLDIHLIPSCRQIDSLALVALYDATDGANWTNTWNLALPMETWHGVILNGDGCVTHLIINNNNLNGSIPPEIGYLSHLSQLYIRWNSGLSGSIPPEIGHLTNLIILYLDHNNLTDNIPPELGNLNKLRRLGLHDNELSGSFPQELGDMEKMTLLLLFNNQLSGCFNDNLITLCSQLGTYSTNSRISRGNNFAISWEDFCNDLSCGSDKVEQNQQIDTHNYPNPFTDHTTIEYTLLKDSPVTLTIYDASGKEIALIHHNEIKTQGIHTVTFEGGLYPAGMYYYTIQAGEYFGTQKMVLMK